MYKYCSKCKKQNHKSNIYCVRCGDELVNDPKFGKNVFAITLSIVILLSSATVFASKSYFNHRSKNNNQQNTQVQNIEPQKAESEIKQEPTKEEVKSEPVTKPTSTKTPAATQTTPPPTTKAVCDSSKRTELTNKYNAGISEARQKRDRLLNEANAEYASAGDRAREKYKDIWSHIARGSLVAQDIESAYRVLEQVRSYTNNDYNSTEMYLTTMYNLDSKSINCPN